MDCFRVTGSTSCNTAFSVNCPLGLGGVRGIFRECDFSGADGRHRCYVSAKRRAGMVRGMELFVQDDRPRKLAELRQCTAKDGPGPLAIATAHRKSSSDG